VTSFGKDTETIKFKKIEKINHAACVYHKGPYSSIGNAYAHLFKWIEDNGYLLSDNPRESYIDGIWNKKDENDWLTELQIPIIKK
jgi:effector-binding domain-containing protein